MPYVAMGNPQTVHHATGEDLGVQETTTVLPAVWPLDHQVRAIVHPDGVWAAHSAAAKPSWIESDSPELAAAVVAAFGGGVPIGRPSPVADPGQPVQA